MSTNSDKMERYERLAAKKPKYYVSIGDIYIEEGAFKAATTYYQKAVDNGVLAYTVLGDTWGYRSQYKKAIDAGADFIFQTDSDGQTRPEEFWPFWEQRENCGLLIGYRKGRQDGVSRVFVTRVLRLVLLLVFHVWVKDANTPFRLMRGEELETVLKKIPDSFFLPNVLMTVIYHKNKRGVTYIPITFRPRQGGVNSLNLKRIFRIGRQAVGDFMALRKKI